MDERDSGGGGLRTSFRKNVQDVCWHARGIKNKIKTGLWSCLSLRQCSTAKPHGEGSLCQDLASFLPGTATIGDSDSAKGCCSNKNCRKEKDTACRTRVPKMEFWSLHHSSLFPPPRWGRGEDADFLNFKGGGLWGGSKESQTVAAKLINVTSQAVLKVWKLSSCNCIN